MKQLIFCICISISIICGLSGCRAQAQYITEAQAIQAVRNFEGDQSLEFDKVELDVDPNPRFGFNGSTYLISKSAPMRDWGVDALSGEISSASYIDRWPSQRQLEPYGSYSQSQCHDIALAYARTKYSGFDGMGFQLKSSKWDDNGWEFQWIQKIAYDAETFNDVTIEVNPCTGQIKYYNSCRVPVITPSAPTVTAQGAIDIAKQYVGISQNLDMETSPWLFVYPDGTLEWNMVISGANSQGYSVMYSVTVNAATGAIINTEQATSFGPVRPNAPENAKKAVEALGKCTSISISGKTIPGKQQEIRQGSKNFTGTIKAVQGLLRNGMGITDKSPGSKAAKYSIRFHTGKDKAIEAKFDPGSSYFEITSQVVLATKSGRDQVVSTEPIPAVITKCPKEFVENMKSAIQSAANTPTKAVSGKR